MAFPRLLLLAFPVAAGALAWTLLGADRPTPARSSDDEPLVERPATPGRPRSTEPGVVAPPPAAAPVEPEDPEWITRDLPPLRGKGPLKGGELVDTLEKAGPLRFRGATDADLDALRRAVFEDVDREAAVPHAALMGWLKEAGFEVVVAYPTLTVRRRTDEGWTGR